MNNMEIWNKLCKVPSWALKKIIGGRLAGKSDINPQWRYEALTEQFGPIGTGWKFTIDKLWMQEVNDGIILCFAQITLSVKNNEKWDAGTPGIGGNQMVAKENKGLHANDECYKMAVTDALSVAAKMYGVGANVYKGLSDGKYDKNPDNKNDGEKKQLPWLNKGTKEFEQAAKAIAEGKRKAKDVRNAYAVNKKIFAELEALEPSESKS